MPEQTLGGIPLGLGMVMKINFFEFSCKMYDQICLGLNIVEVAHDMQQHVKRFLTADMKLVYSYDTWHGMILYSMFM